MSRLNIPGQIAIQTQYNAGPLAHPVTAALPMQDGVLIVAGGGFTKLEAGAMQIAAGLCANNELVNADPEQASIAGTAVKVAKAILDECGEELARQRAAAEQKNGHRIIEGTG